MDYISVTNSIVDNFIVAEPDNVPGLELALGSKLLPREDWPTAERGDRLINEVLYRDMDGVLTDIRQIKPPEPIEPEPNPLEQRVGVLEQQNDALEQQLTDTQLALVEIYEGMWV